MNAPLQAIPALSDNYIWMLSSADSRALVVDPGEADTVRGILEREGLQLVAILLTHHHADHVGGVAALKARWPGATIFAPDDPRMAVVDRRVFDGDRIVIDGTPWTFDVIGVPGHTLSHVSYHGNGVLFCGDTLFSAGCGRLFEGTPAQMLASLERLAALPDETLVCCGHEYTAANLAFAASVDAANAAIVERMREVRDLRALGRPSLPSRMDQERRFNPFLRIDEPAIIAALAAQGLSRSERFGLLRRRKDEFRVPA